MKREFRAERGSVLLFGAITVLIAVALFVADASAFSAFVLFGSIASTGYQLPAVVDTDALEQAVRGSTTDPSRPEHRDLVIHQGGLVRRWGGPTYVVTG